MRLLHSTLSVFVTQVLIQGLAFIPSVLISRQYGDDGKGLIALLLYVPALLFSASSLGLGTAGQYFVSRREGPGAAHVTNAILYPLILAVVVTAGFVASYGFWQPHLDNVSLTTLAPALLILPLTIVLSHCSQLLISFGLVTKRNICFLLQSAATAVLVALIMLIPDASLQLMLWAYIAGFAVGAVLALYYCLREVGSLQLPGLGLLWKSLKYGVWLYLSSLIRALFARVSFFLLVAVENIADGGVYSVALALTSPLVNVPWAVQAVLFPRSAAQTEEEARRSLPRYFRQVSLVMLLIGGAVALLSRPILMLFGPEFVRGQATLCVLLIGILFGGQNAILNSFLMGRGRPQVDTYVTLLSLVFLVILNLLLISPLGMLGAALATTGSRAIRVIASLLYYGRIMGEDTGELFRFRRSDLHALREIRQLIAHIWRIPFNRSG